MTPRFAPGILPPSIGRGANKICPPGSDMAAFEYRQAEEIRKTLAQHRVRYLSFGKSGAILLGFPDTTQDADLYPERTIENCRALARALMELGFCHPDDIITSKAAANRQKDRVSRSRGCDPFANGGVQQRPTRWIPSSTPPSRAHSARRQRSAHSGADGPSCESSVSS